MKISNVEITLFYNLLCVISCVLTLWHPPMMLTIVILTFLKSTREPMVPGPFHFCIYGGRGKKIWVLVLNGWPLKGTKTMEGDISSFMDLFDGGLNPCIPPCELLVMNKMKCQCHNMMTTHACAPSDLAGYPWMKVAVLKF